MDMKKILQALDTASSKPVEGSNDMKRFVSIIQEGANPHKVTLPVQMAMQHYSKPVEKKQPRDSVIGKYFTEAEQAIVHRQVYKTVEIQEKAQRIVERLRLKESALRDKEDLKAKRKALQDIQLDPHTHKDPELRAELIRRKAALEKEAKHKGFDESGEAGWSRVGMAGVGLQANEDELDERSVSQAQAHMMAAAAHNPEFAKKVKIKPSVAKEFNKADKGKNIKSLPPRVPKK